MARYTKEVTVSAKGRDQGKKFLITEMPATQAEKWAARMLMTMVKAGFDIPDELMDGGMQALVAVGAEAIARSGLKAFGNLDFFELEPLLDEMFSCIQIVEPALTRAPTDDDIEEVLTRVMLRGEVLSLHANFSLPVRQPARG